jgi:hypothetical protein
MNLHILIFYPEDGGSRFLPNSGKYFYIASHPRTLDSSLILP